MAFMGVLLGLFARVGAEQGLFEAVGYSSAAGMDPELGLPLLLRNVLPIGVMGLLLAAYFSAIMSTADSCLMAASGNVITDIFGLTEGRKVSQKSQMRVSQIVTLLLGSAAILLASQMQNVLELMLYSYAFMVSGLFIPVLGFLFYRTPPRTAAFWSMLLGGTTTLSLTALPQALPWGLDPIFFGIVIGGLTFLLIRTFKKG
jgi:SSS family solute:Na+ symporter